MGVRETRRILGEYLLTEADVLRGRKFEVGIALGAWAVEFHNPKKGKVAYLFLEKEDDYYSIPAGCLIPKTLNNLLVAGRCISTTHVAQASTQVIGPTFAMGEAAGILGANAADSNLAPRNVSIETIRKELIKGGAILAV